LDDGDGIEPDLMPRLFELFSQGRRSEHRLHDGLGIGLALVHRLVDMHGGTVAADSAGKGLGAEFVVRLPLSDAVLPAPAPVPARRAVRDAATRLRVLVVDDNRDAAESMAMLLEAMDVEVAMAHDGLAA